MIFKRPSPSRLAATRRGARRANGKKRSPAGSRPTKSGTGFTLVELMISIGIALVLILGINEVFKIAARTVGAGQAISGINSDNRTAHYTMETDIKNAMTQSTPAFIISSNQIFAYRNVDAKNSASNGGVDPSYIDLPGNGGTTQLDRTTVNEQSHRQDLLSFFASGDLYSRQTANTGQYISPTTSNEAYVWYGMTQLPDNKAAAAMMTAGAPTVGTWYYPGYVPTAPAQNDNNLYASDWILGRVAMLMVPTPPTADDYITGKTAGSNPLATDAMSTTINTPTAWNILQSRYDLVNASITSYRSSQVSTPIANRIPMIGRFWANPFLHKPLDAIGMAGAAPIFLRHCSQFIVEYAGDFVTQTQPQFMPDGVTPNPMYGQVDKAGSDGAVDYYIDNGVRRIRWYGFPRDPYGDNKIDGTHGVIPLRDVLAWATTPPTTGSDFEQFTALPQPASATTSYVGTLSANSNYTCAWGTEVTEPLPQMLRITIALDDPNGRLASSQTFEYVIDLQH